ncbi:zinc-dependent alcohol dehydrogenase family protein, partial [Leucobacter sp. M11]|uniref:zinc-dependent alcohol dehydrogenase family protein n=1 Tax=Leucobacter sp. M11 TaxID=2993565 RepID=UPI002D7F93F0
MTETEPRRSRAARRAAGTMLAVIAERPGPLSAVLRLREVPVPGEPAPGQVAVRMLLSTVNPSDAVTVSGAYPSRTSFPFVPGFEGIGEVVRVGSGVPAALLGQRVLPLGSAGNWQEIKHLEAAWCVPVPDDVSDEAACFAAINPLTASLMLGRFLVPGVRRVLVTAAASAIAGHLAELLAARGVLAVGTVRGGGRAVPRPGHWAAVLDTRTPGWPARAIAELGGPPQLVLDAVGGPGGGELSQLLAPGGVLVLYGLLSGEPLPASCFAGTRGTRTKLFRLRDTLHGTTRERLPASFGPVFARLAAGGLATAVGERIGLDDLVSALRRRAGAAPPGKLL